MSSCLDLNMIRPAEGSVKNRKRKGRGIGSGLGKTCGKGHKGQNARSGGGKPLTGFEGGQMPLYRRLPKVGFKSRVSFVTTDIRTSELAKVEGDVISIETLAKSHLITSNIKRAKIFLSGDVKKAYKVVGLRVTKGARAAIEAAGGSVE